MCMLILSHLLWWGYSTCSPMWAHRFYTASLWRQLHDLALNVPNTAVRHNSSDAPHTLLWAWLLVWNDQEVGNVHFLHPHAQKAPVNDYTDYMTCYAAFDNTQAQFPRPSPKSIVSVERSAPVGDTFDLCSSRCWGLLILLSSQPTSAPQAADSSHVYLTSRHICMQQSRRWHVSQMTRHFHATQVCRVPFVPPQSHCTSAQIFVTI